MIFGTLTVRLLIRESRSLKDKRQVLRAIKDRLRNDFNVSVAEIEALNDRQLAVLGVAMVHTETHAIKKAFGRITQSLRLHPTAELLDSQIEV